MEKIRGVFVVINLWLVIDLVLRGEKETESTWAWILLLLNFPILGFSLFFLTGQKIPQYKTEKVKEDLGSITEDNRIEVLSGGEEKFGSLFEDIQNAKKEIFIQYYIFKDDFLFRKLISLLSKKAKEGVEIKVLYDTFGSRKIKKETWKRIQRTGIEVKSFKASFWRTCLSYVRGFNYRNHRKIVVIDQYIGYVGGYNIGKEYLGMDLKFGFWRDTHFRIVGSAAGALRNVFLRDWGEEMGEVKKGGKGGSALQIVTSGPTSSSPHIRNVYLRCIGNARHIIRIQTPYFVPDTAMLNALKLALLSGKEVKLMIPAKQDHMFVHWATRYYAAQLLSYGAKVYFYKEGFLHAKGMVMDEDIYCYGTANMDIRSFYLNYEVNIIVYGRNEVEKMCHIFDCDLKSCRELTWQEYASRSLEIRIKEQISRLLSPLL